MMPEALFCRDLNEWNIITNRRNHNAEEIASSFRKKPFSLKSPNFTQHRLSVYFLIKYTFLQKDEA